MSNGISPSNACELSSIDGSWLLLINVCDSQRRVRGPMRIEVDGPSIRVSGDIYVKQLTAGEADPEATSPITGDTLLIEDNWYPAYPQSEYRWYFRSQSAKLNSETGKLEIKFERRLWNPNTQEFAGSDTGDLSLACTAGLVRVTGAPVPTSEMTGELTLGDASLSVRALKTSTFYRGCAVEVDVMKNRDWPETASNAAGNRTFSFTGIYREQGLDFLARVDDTDIAQDSVLTTAELHTLLTNRRETIASSDSWRFWLLVGSRQSNNTFGVMFDQRPPHREGAVGYFDATFNNSLVLESSARGKKLGEVPLGFLRTLVHEAGHGFNLFHPKADVHTVAVGTTIMNQTGDVIGFATQANPYPSNSTMAFNEHNRRSLTHSPDPQVKPGWKRFGWGHSSVFAGVAEPTDVLGFDAPGASDGLEFNLELPGEIATGDFIVAQLTLTNVGDTAQQVPTAINLAEGYLRASVTTPFGATETDVRDMTYACSDARYTTLKPKDSITGSVQLYYTNRGYLFRTPGLYRVQFALDLGRPDAAAVRSDAVDLSVRPAQTDEERQFAELMGDESVGVALALGNVVPNSDAEKKVKAIVADSEAADADHASDRATACALLLANSTANGFRDLAKNKMLRKANAKAAEDMVANIFARSAVRTCAALAAAVVAPSEREAPLIRNVSKLLDAPPKGHKMAKADIQAASKTISDHMA